jgi:hypothetical protein
MGKLILGRPSQGQTRYLYAHSVFERDYIRSALDFNKDFRPLRISFEPRSMARILDAAWPTTTRLTAVLPPGSNVVDSGGDAVSRQRFEVAGK